MMVQFIVYFNDVEYSTIDIAIINIQFLTISHFAADVKTTKNQISLVPNSTSQKFLKTPSKQALSAKDLIKLPKKSLITTVNGALQFLPEEGDNSKSSERNKFLVQEMAVQINNQQQRSTQVLIIF